MINDDFIHYKGISESELRNIKVENELFFREDLTKEELEELTAYNRDKLGNRPDILLFPKEHKCIIIELKVWMRMYLNLYHKFLNMQA